MKISWLQVIISVLIGLLIGSNLTNFGFHDCKNCFHKSSHYKSSWKHHDKYKCDGCHDKKDKKHFMMERLSEKLNLTSDQQSKLSAIMDEKHKKIMELHKSTQGEIKNILTAEQQKKFDEISAKWEEKRESWQK